MHHCGMMGWMSACFEPDANFACTIQKNVLFIKYFLDIRAQRLCYSIGTNDSIENTHTRTGAGSFINHRILPSDSYNYIH
jgi:hypothetical protein